MQSVPGLTSKKIQKFLNGICREANTYLEVGCALGATASAALEGNDLKAFFIDNWKEDIQPMRDDLEKLPKNTKESFIKNIEPYIGDNTIKVIESDMFRVNIDEIDAPIDVFFYDASHDFENTSKAIQYYSKTFSDEVIIIVDDANFEGVVLGAIDGIEKSGYFIKYQKLILNGIEDPTAWWNGVYIILVAK